MEEGERIQSDHGSQLWEWDQQRLAVPLPAPLAPGDMQEVGCPCAQIFAVVSLAYPVIGILTDNVSQFCCVIMKDFLNKVTTSHKVGPFH